jgi:hypothetical protein
MFDVLEYDGKLSRLVAEVKEVIGLFIILEGH